MNKKNHMEVEVIILKRNQVIKETILLEEIWRNNTREQEVLKEFNWKIWEQILQDNYKPVDIGYLGQQRILELIKRNYW